MSGHLPTGTVTFLFTDIEGSTQLWERLPQAMPAALARHDQLLHEVIERHNGRIVKNLGDGIYAVFRRAGDAVAAAIAAQLELGKTDERQPVAPEKFTSDPPAELVTRHSSPVTIKVRMGLHTGEAELREGDYHGSALNRAERLMSAGHGGQILLSATTAAVCEGALPSEATLRDLGEHRLRGLSRPERLYQLLVPDLPSSFPPLRSLGEYVVSLPSPATRFVGRDAEVRQIVNLLNDPAIRLISLVGPGGTGKTRLAVAAAGQIGRAGSDRFLDGVYFVPLASLVAGDAMVSAVAQTVGFRFRQSEEPPRRQLLDFLRRKRVLLVMDNCEHLLDEGGADLPADILENAPDVAILATSRTRINLPGEYLINVGGLPAPDAYTIRRWQALAESEAEVETVIARAAADYAAVRLFAQSAARVRPGFRLRADNIADVARICRQVQGLPLGIELAAAWLEALSLPDIAAEIERNLDILATEQRGVPDRQRSIRAVFDTSWALLSDRERAILPMLSVFRGGFAREAAEFVAAASLRDLLGLVNKSWLQPSETRNTRYERRDRPEDAETGTRRSSPAARFQLHALLRQYAEEKLAEMPELEEQARDRQARYFARFLESHLRRMLGREQARAFNAVAEEFDDIHQTWEWWAQRGEFGRLVDQMLLPLFLYATARFVGTDVAPLLDRAIALLQPAAGQAAADPLPAIRLACLLIARAAIYINYFTREFTPGNVDAAWATAQALGDEAPARLGFWYAPLNLTYGWRTARLPAVNNLRAYIAAPGDADEITVAFARQALARLLIREFAPEVELLEARQQVGEALTVFERLGNEDARAAACNDQSDISTLLGRYDEALAFLDRAQPAAEAIGNWGMTWIILLSRREVYLQQGQPERMFPIFDEMLAMSRRVGNFRLECWTLSWDSIYALRYHSLERALFKRQGAMLVAEQFGLAYDRAWSSLELGDIYRVMGDAAAARRWFDSALPQFEQQEMAQGRAFYRRGLGDLALGRGAWAKAYEHHRAFLDWADGRDTWSHIYALSGVGRAATGLGRLDEALAYLRRALSLTVSGSRRDTVSLPVACLAHLAAAAGRADLAGRLAAAVAASPLTWLETRAWVREWTGEPQQEAPPVMSELVGRLMAAEAETVEEWLSRMASGT
ncbi:MAG: hypothetical protein H6663_10090 [Candidatus Promineofilum sp.]|nr:hypothetical protein [Promineifilum sp.]